MHVGLREYPKGLGKALIQIWNESSISQTPVPCLRQKYDLQHYHSEWALFTSLPLGDPWGDAQLIDVYMYLVKNKKLSIPNVWRETIQQFTEELKNVPGLNLWGMEWHGCSGVLVSPSWVLWFTSSFQP